MNMIFWNLPESTPQERDYKAYKLRQMRTDLSTKIKALEKAPASPALPLPEPEPKAAK